MARITVEDCQERVNNRFLLVQMAIKRVHQYRDGYEPLIESRNKEAVTALREIAAGKQGLSGQCGHSGPLRRGHEGNRADHAGRRRYERPDLR